MSEASAFRSVPERHFRLSAAALLVVMGASQMVGAVADSQTYDESYHLVNGYAFLKSRTMVTISEHPPLSQVISAAPLLFLDLRMPLESVPNRPEDEREADFLYKNKVSAETMLRLARVPKILLTLLLGWVMTWWMRPRFGAVAALAALTLFSFDPNFLAHGHYVTTDVPATLCFTVACLAWARFLTDGTMKSAAWCGLAMGVAMGTKYSALLLFFIFGFLYFFRIWQKEGEAPGPVRWSPFHLAKGMVVFGVVMLAVVWAAFGFETGHMLTPEIIAALRGIGFPNVGADTAFNVAATQWTIPAPSFFRGLFVLTLHNVRGHPSYLMGMHSLTGWWYYFPVVAAVKTPTGALLLLAIAVVAVVRAVAKTGVRHAVAKLRQISPDWYVLILPPALYFAICVRSNINLGIRHVLPIYPLVYMWTAAVLFSRDVAIPARFRKAGAICVALVMLESASAFPRYLGFFNLPSGGPRNGARYLVDSNLDWGQDLKRLKAYLTERGISNVCLNYFGTAPPSYYGIHAKPAPASLEDARASGCVVVMSVTAMYERQSFDGRYDWAMRTPPTDTVGDSFRVYDPNRIR
jgi:hypothetical protein